MQELALKHSLDAPSADPRISVQISEPERLNLVLRIPVQARRRGRIEQEISKKYLMNLEALEASKSAGEMSTS